MVQPALNAFRAMPEPRRVIAVGDGFSENNVFRGSYALVPMPEEIRVALVSVQCGTAETSESQRSDYIPGDPPMPQQILQTLRGLEQR
jgi:Ni,Fe-hydrogenase III small subunit